MPRISYKDAVDGKDGRLNRADAARWLGVSTKCLAEWKRKGMGPRCSKMGELCFYYVEDLKDYVRSKSNRQ